MTHDHQIHAPTLDLRGLRLEARPLSPAGRALRDTRGLFAPEDVDAQREWYAALDTLERGLDARPAADSALRDHLATLPDVADLLHHLTRCDEALSQAQIFRLDEWAHHLDAALEHALLASGAPLLPEPLPAQGKPGGIAARWHAARCTWRRHLRPPHHPAGPWRLVDGFDERLQAPREERRRLERERVRQRGDARRSLQADYGCPVDAQRLLRLPASDPRLTRAHEDPRLEARAASAFEQTFALVPSADERALTSTIDALDAQIDALEAEVCERCTAGLRSEVHKLTRSYQAGATLDLLYGLICLKRRWQGCWPTPGATLRLAGAVLPALDDALRTRGERCRPLDLSLAPGATLLTGPNMGGKSVTLQTIATCTYLALLGYPLPATHAEIPIVRSLYLLQGDLADDTEGLSAFGGEVERLRDALNAPEPKLLLLDEWGKSTNPREGSALGGALLEHLATQPTLSLYASHLPLAHPTQGGFVALGMVGLADADPGLLDADVQTHGWRAALRRHMRYQLRPLQRADAPAEALRIAAWAGLPPSLIERAHLGMQEPSE